MLRLSFKNFSECHTNREIEDFSREIVTDLGLTERAELSTASRKDVVISHSMSIPLSDVKDVGNIKKIVNTLAAKHGETIFDFGVKENSENNELTMECDFSL